MPVPAPLRTTVSSRGQVVLPKAIRTELGWTAGTRLIVEKRPEGVLFRREPLIDSTRIEEVRGCLRWTGEPVSIEQMDAAVLREARRRLTRAGGPAGP